MAEYTAKINSIDEGQVQINVYKDGEVYITGIRHPKTDLANLKELLKKDIQDRLASDTLQSNLEKELGKFITIEGVE